MLRPASIVRDSRNVRVSGGTFSGNGDKGVRICKNSVDVGIEMSEMARFFPSPLPDNTPFPVPREAPFLWSQHLCDQMMDVPEGMPLPG